MTWQVQFGCGPHNRQPRWTSHWKGNRLSLWPTTTTPHFTRQPEDVRSPTRGHKVDLGHRRGFIRHQASPKLLHQTPSQPQTTSSDTKPAPNYFIRHQASPKLLHQTPSQPQTTSSDTKPAPNYFIRYQASPKLLHQTPSQPQTTSSDTKLAPKYFIRHQASPKLLHQTPSQPQTTSQRTWVWKQCGWSHQWHHERQKKH